MAKILKVKNGLVRNVLMIVISWVPVAGILTLLFGTIYGTVQQTLRQSANDPQIQVSREYADIIQGGQDPTGLVPPQKTDISKSLSVFLIIYDKDGKALASSAELNGQTPTPPQGVFDFTKKHLENRLTWEPQKGVRIAAVLNYFKGDKNEGFVLAGKSLALVEEREAKISMISFVGWALSLVFSLFCITLLKIFKSRL